MKLSANYIFWLLSVIVFIGLLVVLQEVLLPFILGLAIAYLLDPVVDRFEEKMPRWLATSSVLMVFVIVFGSILAVVIPILQSQFLKLIAEIPSYIEQIETKLIPLLKGSYTKFFPGHEVSELDSLISDYSSEGMEWATLFVKKLWSGGGVIFNIISILIVTPVVAFYLLRDWDILTAKIDDLLPRKNLDTIRDLFKQIDETLSGFIRGQFSVCILLGAFYGISLTILGLNFGLFIGLAAGILSFVPYIGSIVGFGIGLAVAYFQFEGYHELMITAGIFMAGQMLEGNVLTPKLVGEKVGLHAVWIVFALMAGGNLFGFVGMMVAVPIAAVCGVMIRFSTLEYKKSCYYNGEIKSVTKKKAVKKKKTVKK